MSCGSTDPGLRRLGDTNPTVRIDVIWTRAPGWDGDLTQISLSANGQSASTIGAHHHQRPRQRQLGTDGGGTGDGRHAHAAHARAHQHDRAARRLTASCSSTSTRTVTPPTWCIICKPRRSSVGGTAARTLHAAAATSWSVTLSTTPTTYQWTLPAADMQRTKGRRARIIARMKSIAGATYVRPKILDGGGAQVLWTGDELYLGSLTDDGAARPGYRATAAGRLRRILRSAPAGAGDAQQRRAYRRI